jgi:DNA-binding CsgD family transcriptional regulator
VLVFLAEAAVALRDTDAARQLRPLLAPFTGRQLIAGHFVALFGPADAYLASLDSVLGDDESAERLFERALTQNRLLGSVVHRAAILAAWADHMRSRGDLSRRYKQMRDEARRLAASTGQARLIHMLDTPTEHAAGLTAREIDVLRLISRGRSNRDIAAELKITENTAANHVRSILIKTGAANRTQVAMMAVSRRWVDDHAQEFTP